MKNIIQLFRALHVIIQLITTLKKMKNLIIEMNDFLFTFAFIIYAVIGLIAGYGYAGIGGGIFGLLIGSFIGAMLSGFWFVLSGIYHNTKPQKVNHSSL